MPHSTFTETDDQRTTSRDTLKKILKLAEQNAAEIGAARADLADMKGLLAAWRNARGAIRTLTFLASAARWFAWVGGSIAFFLYWIKSGNTPP